MRNRIHIDSKHSRALDQEIEENYARSCKKSRTARRILEGKSTGSANFGRAVTINHSSG